MAFATVDKKDGLINGETGSTGAWDETHAGGNACQNFAEILGPGWDLVPGGGPAIFDYDENRWMTCTTAYIDETQKLEVIADIELYVREHLDGTKVYFHIADDTVTSLSADITGSLSTNHTGMWIGLCKRGDVLPEDSWGPNDGPIYFDAGMSNKAAQLVWKKDGLGRNILGSPIPLLIQYSEAGLPWRTIAKADSESQWSQGVGNLWGYYWRTTLGPCTHPFRFRFTITPPPHPQDGRYELDPTVVLSPGL
jgi:hypothetical protein